MGSSPTSATMFHFKRERGCARENTGPWKGFGAALIARQSPGVQIPNALVKFQWARNGLDGLEQVEEKRAVFGPGDVKQGPNRVTGNSELKVA